MSQHSRHISQNKAPLQKLDMSNIAPESNLPLVEQNAADDGDDSDDKFWENWKSNIPEHLIGDSLMRGC